MSSRLPRRSAIAEDQIGADRELALIHTPVVARGPLRALYEIDSAMADVVARATDPALARIKLAWWREQLESLDTEPAPAEPRLQAAAAQILPNGVTGKQLGELEAGWATLLDEDVDAGLVSQRGAILFAIGGRLLQASDDRLEDAGALYALASVGRRGVPELFRPARERLGAIGAHRFSRGVRPLTMLARAAARDLDRSESEFGKGRALAMLAHRWSGRIA